jgi:D-alanyl-lipoteichoic acid acyltransferase DltB (MBOAT superfamily)
MYSIQIYSDFAGYSLMAVGVGKLLGFELINNFRRPYFSVSITDFWHRWHISLSRWLKDYVYIPLGGSHCSRINNYWNIFVTFLVSGIWHGANWTFIIWGIIHGGCQIIEKILGWNKIEYKGLKRGLRIVFTFIVITLAWVIFRSPSISEACKFMWHYFSRTGMIIPAGDNNLWYIVICLIPFTIYEFLMEFAMPMYNRLSGITFIRWMTYFIISCMILLFGVLDGSTFIYANF